MVFLSMQMGGRQRIIRYSRKNFNWIRSKIKLVKSMEDQQVKYDLSVRTSGNIIVQFIYIRWYGSNICRITASIN